ncbi:mitochondrial ribosomal small subunit component [Agyrium rufum]|nr:mitochondrial ribosomal small subunit component [Agyrium rufum]
MGRYDFRPQRVHQKITSLLATQRIERPPGWYEVVGSIAPSQMLVRTQPIQHGDASRPRKRSTKKPSRLFQPIQITYEEDEMRKTFFTDHPWELARPRLVIEGDGRDYERVDWSRIRQEFRPLDGEAVVQRQRWLMNPPKGPDGRPIQEPLSQDLAYDQAREEFYAERLQEDEERDVAKEEALATGAQFRMTTMDVAMQLESEQHEKWKGWAYEEDRMESLRVSSGGMGSPTAQDSESLLPDDLAGDDEDRSDDENA